jgi:DNA-binding transcriptional MocR family regulator
VKPRYVWRNAVFASTLKPSERLVALALEQHMDPNGKAWPSKARLSSTTGLSTRTVQSALRGLVAKGWLEIAAPSSQHRSATYRTLLRGEMVASLEDAQGSNSRPPGEQITTVRGAMVAPEPLRTSKRTSTSSRAPAREGKRKSARTGGARSDLTVYDEAVGEL